VIPPGFVIFTDIHLADPIYGQTFTPKSKKKRIITKCAKRYRALLNWKPWERVFFSGDTMICHPEIANKLKEELNALSGEAYTGNGQIGYHGAPGFFSPNQVG